MQVQIIGIIFPSNNIIIHVIEFYLYFTLISEAHHE